jgi:hypothetical protein
MASPGVRSRVRGLLRSPAAAPAPPRDAPCRSAGRDPAHNFFTKRRISHFVYAYATIHIRHFDSVHPAQSASLHPGCDALKPYRLSPCRPRTRVAPSHTIFRARCCPESGAATTVAQGRARHRGTRLGRLSAHDPRLRRCLQCAARARESWRSQTPPAVLPAAQAWPPRLPPREAARCQPAPWPPPRRAPA